MCGGEKMCGCDQNCEKCCGCDCGHVKGTLVSTQAGSYEKGTHLKSAMREVLRAVLLIAIAVLASGYYFGDSGSLERNKLVLYVIGIEALLGLFAHIFRRLLFPSFYIGSAINRACDTPDGAAKVVSAFIVLLCVLIALPFWFLIKAAGV